MPAGARLTTRYKGFSRLLNSFRQLGFLNTGKLDRPVSSPQELLDTLLEQSANGKAIMSGERGDANRMSIIKERLADEGLVEETVGAMKWRVQFRCVLKQWSGPG